MQARVVEILKCLLTQRMHTIDARLTSSQLPNYRLPHHRRMNLMFGLLALRLGHPYSTHEQLHPKTFFEQKRALK